MLFLFKHFQAVTLKSACTSQTCLHIVKPHMAIDEEARVRATSIYLVDRVIPMFPEVLSNDLCSLNEKEDKLVFSSVFTFAPEAFSDTKTKVVVKDKWFGRCIINSAKRFTYENAQEILDNGDGLFYNELNMLNVMARRCDLFRWKEWRPKVMAPNSRLSSRPASTPRQPPPSEPTVRRRKNKAGGSAPGHRLKRCFLSA